MTEHPIWIDTHCHLDYDDLVDQGIEHVIARAHDADVKAMVSISTHLSKSQQVIDVADKNQSVFCTIGLHPHHAGEEAEQPLTTVENLIDLSQSHPKIVGIGESGLDYFYDFAPKEAQQESFRVHIRACMATGLPLVIHARDADDDVIKIIREETTSNSDAKHKLRAVLHCFSSTRKLAEFGLEMGFYISASGIMTFKRSEELRAIFRDIPLDRLLVETDAPFLAPQPKRGKTCEPAYTAMTGEILADVKGISPAELAEHTTANTLRFFDRMTAPSTWGSL